MKIQIFPYPAIGFWQHLGVSRSTVSKATYSFPSVRPFVTPHVIAPKFHDRFLSNSVYYTKICRLDLFYLKATLFKSENELLRTFGVP
jgi:hypothetical protein